MFSAPAYPAFSWSSTFTVVAVVISIAIEPLSSWPSVQFPTCCYPMSRFVAVSTDYYTILIDSIFLVCVPSSFGVSVLDNGPLPLSFFPYTAQMSSLSHLCFVCLG